MSAIGQCLRLHAFVRGHGGIDAGFEVIELVRVKVTATGEFATEKYRFPPGVSDDTGNVHVGFRQVTGNTVAFVKQLSEIELWHMQSECSRLT